MHGDIKKTLWATADKLRANMDAAEYRHLVLGLIFLKYVSDTFTALQAEVMARLQSITQTRTTWSLSEYRMARMSFFSACA